MLCDCWVELLRALCGDPRRTRKEVLGEKERLLGDAPPSEHHQEAADEREPMRPFSTRDGPSTVIVMRHGHRQDEEDAKWHLTASRPWDPPLSKLGRAQARDAGKIADMKHVDLVITSPFKRCLQTSAQVVSVLDVPQGKWLADWRLSEVSDPRVLFSGRLDIKEQMKERPLAGWMWGGLPMHEALDKFIEAERQVDSLTVHPEVRPTDPPRFPETLHDGLQRYQDGLQNIMDAYPGKTVLVVTHGECVRQAVSMMQPASEVFEVKHTSYVIMHKEAGGQWRLVTEPGESGVIWIED